MFQIAEKRKSKAEGDKLAKERRGQRYGEGASSKKRTISQIMKEDNVSRTEATKIFKNQ